MRTFAVACACAHLISSAGCRTPRRSPTPAFRSSGSTPAPKGSAPNATTTTPASEPELAPSHKSGPAADTLAAPGVATATLDGPLGALLLAATPQGLTRVAFEGHGDFDALRAHATSRRGSQAARRHLADTAAKLRDYFAGNTDRVQWAIDWAFLESSGAPALRSTESIPYAGHRSYIDLTNAGSARDLGRIMGANPIPIVAPCHRVTRGVEIPTTFVGGSDRRHWLQNHETTAKDAPPQ